MDLWLTKFKTLFMKSFTKKHYEKFVKRFPLRSDKHTGISPLTNKNVQSGKENVLVN